MNNLLPYTTTTTELQRNYKKVANRVKRLKQPVTVLSHNKPIFVIWDYTQYQNFQKDRVNTTVAKKHKDSYGIFAKAKISDRDIDAVVKNWDRHL